MSVQVLRSGDVLTDVAYHLSAESPNIIHMSVRPPDLDEEEPKAGGKNAGGPGSDGRRSRTSGGCCVIL